MAHPSRTQVLLEGLGWPAQHAQHPAAIAGPAVVAGGTRSGSSGQRSDEEELRVQLLTLQVVRLTWLLRWCKCLSLSCGLFFCTSP